MDVARIPSLAPATIKTVKFEQAETSQVENQKSKQRKPPQTNGPKRLTSKNKLKKPSTSRPNIRAIPWHDETSKDISSEKNKRKVAMEEKAAETEFGQVEPEPAPLLVYQMGRPRSKPLPCGCKQEWFGREKDGILKYARQHGFKWPLNPWQVFAWCVIVFLFIMLMGFCLSLDNLAIAMCLAFFWFVLLCLGVGFKICTTLTDPVDENCIRASPTKRNNRGDVVDDVPVANGSPPSSKDYYKRPRPRFEPGVTAPHVVMKFPTTAFCNVCEVRVSRRSRHCRHCNKCIRGWDHHCDWLNNCIGSRNFKTFILFIGSIAIATTLANLFLIILLILQWNNPDMFYRTDGEEHDSNVGFYRCMIPRWLWTVLWVPTFVMMCLASFSTWNLGIRYYKMPNHELPTTEPEPSSARGSHYPVSMAKPLETGETTSHFIQTEANKVDVT